MLLAALFAAYSIASPTRSRALYAVKETHPVPGKWTRVGPAPENRLLRLQIGLTQGRFHELEKHLYQGIYL
jgi:tripeptidyl-peptidase-1